jgi:hypothetical protein
MNTRVPLTEAEKDYIYERKHAGASLNQIAEEVGCAPITARKWWRHRRDGTHPQARGRPKRGELSTYPEAVRKAAVAIKRARPHSGPANVNLELKQQLQLTDEELPSHSRLSALFKAQCPEAVQPRQRYHYRQKPPPVAKYPHQLWQVDSKEAIRFGDEAKATALNIRDPKGALIIASRVFKTTTPRGWRKLTREEVQDVLRGAFTEWGLPEQIQTDREDVYIGAPQAPFPTLFTLWLAGLGITHVVSRNHKPTDQAAVERTHRTLGDLVWKDTYFDELEPLQQALDATRYRYNHEFPVQAADCKGRPPLIVYPHARHSGRPFHPDFEWLLFDLNRVDRYLSTFVWTRQVWSNGKVSVGGHQYSVGKAYAAQTISVRFIPDSRSFRFQAKDGSFIVERPALGLDKETIIGRIPVTVSDLLCFQLPLPLQWGMIL